MGADAGGRYALTIGRGGQQRTYVIQLWAVDDAGLVNGRACHRGRVVANVACPAEATVAFGALAQRARDDFDRAAGHRAAR